MRVSRHELLQRLLMVLPGVSRRKSIAQSNCVVLRRGYFYTLSQEIACAIKSRLPEEMEGAIQIDKLLEALKKIPDDDLNLKLEESILTIDTSRRAARARIPLETEVLLPVDEVERPKDWQMIGGDFTEAVELTTICTRIRKSGEECAFLHECIHLAPDFLEASDNRHLARYQVTVPIFEPVLVRGESLSQIKQLGMERIATTGNWLHFGNGTGLRLSVRKFAVEMYPDLGPFLKLRGREIVLPKTLERAASVAAVFSDSDMVGIRLDTDKLLIRGSSQAGEYLERCKIKYQGPAHRFQVPAKLLMDLVSKYAECEIGAGFLRVSSDHYTYMTSLVVPQRKEI